MTRKNVSLIFAVALALFVFSTIAQAADHDWNGAVAGDWHTGGNWIGDVGGVPAAGNSVNFPANTTVDINGSNVVLPGTPVTSKNLTVFDSDEGTSAETFQIGSWVHDANITLNVPITADTLESTRAGYHFNRANAVTNLIIRGQHQDSTEINVAPSITMTLIDERNTDNSATDHDDMLFINADVTVTTYKQQHGGLTVGPGATFTPVDWQYTQGHIVNNGTIVGTTPSALPASQTWTAGVDGAIPNNTITVNSAARMSIGAVQTGTWDNSNLITVKSGAVLDGDMTNAVFTAGGTQNVSIEGGAIYAPSAGDTLAQGDIVSGSNVILGALHLRLTSAAETVQGHLTTDKFRGVAVGPFTEFWNNGRIQGTFTTAAATGDMEVYMLSNATAQGNNGEWFNFIGNATSTTANIIADGGRLQVERLNDKAITLGTANRITTFNFSNAKANNENQEVLRIAKNKTNPVINVEQTLNTTGGKVFVDMDTAGAGMHGTLNIGDGSGLNTDDASNFTSATGKIHFASGSAFFPQDNNWDVFESLGAGNFTVEASPAKAPLVHTREDSSTINLDTGVDPMPNLNKLLDVSDFIIEKNNGTQTVIGTRGIAIPDGRWFMTGDTGNLTLGAGTTYLGIKAGASSMGIATFTGQTLTVGPAVQAGGATLNVGSATALTTVKNHGNFQRFTAVPDGFVNFSNTVTADDVVVASLVARFNAAWAVANSVDVQSGRVETTVNQTITDLNVDGSVDTNSGSTITVTGTLSGSGVLQDNGTIIEANGTIAPGGSVGGFGDGDGTLDLGVGSIFEMEIAGVDDTLVGDQAGLLYDTVDVEVFEVSGAWTLTLSDAGITADILATDTMVVASAGTFTGDPDTNVTIDLGTTGWSGGSLSIDSGNLILSGLTGSPSASIITDLNGDDIVDDKDLNLRLSGAFTQPELDALLADFGGVGTKAGPAAVPEPGSLFLLLGALGLVPLLRRKK